MTEPKDVFLRFSPDGAALMMSWKETLNGRYHEEGVARIGGADTISIENEKHQISELIQALIKFNDADLKTGFQERGQTTLGTFLFEQTVGQVGHLRDQADVHVRIDVTDTADDHIIRLPWPLLCRNLLYLSSPDTR